MRNLYISSWVRHKLLVRHYVTEEEINECFSNRIRHTLEDTRENHRTEPPTIWFIARTNNGRLLKIVFMEYPDGTYEIKTAYEPNQEEIRIYEKYA